MNRSIRFVQLIQRHYTSLRREANRTRAMSLPQAALLSITLVIPPGGSLAAALQFYIGQDGVLVAITLVEINDRS